MPGREEGWIVQQGLTYADVIFFSSFTINVVCLVPLELFRNKWKKIVELKEEAQFVKSELIAEGHAL